MRALPLLALALLAAPASAQRGEAPFVIAETGEGFGTLDDAVRTILNGRTATILIAPGTYHQCAVQGSGRITFKARVPGTAIFDGVACEDKAAFVLRGEGSAVDGIVFRNIQVPDGNGAGIRIELGDLTVTNSMFLDSQQGMLGATDRASRIRIDQSTFSGLGYCADDCAHGIYLGTHGSVTITRSRFERGTGGHYVKLRAPTVTITDSSFDDTAGRKTNYMIDLSEGGTGLIARNTFVQGRNKENWSGLIVVSAEGRTFPAGGLRVENNVATLAPGVDTHPAFVANASGEDVRLAANRLGAGIKPFETR